ncbi:MAG: GC-type dockerin domain-anchored protein [Phycisphaerales bacterium]
MRCNRADVASLGGGPVPDGQITQDDMIVFLDGFFANNLLIADVAGLGGSAGPDGQLTQDDITFFLGQFFAPCCGAPCDMMRMGGGIESGMSKSGLTAADAADRRAAAVIALRAAFGISLDDNATPDQMIEAITAYFSALSVPVQPAGPASRD